MESAEFGGVMIGPKEHQDGNSEPLPFMNLSSDQGSSSFDLLKDNKKPRKKYTQTKQRENWSDEDHQKFIEALKLFDRDWKQLEKHIGTKTIPQIRSHAQKYFLKVQKSGSGAHVPPPRIPKRKQQKISAENATSTKSTNPDATQSTDLAPSQADPPSSNLPALPGLFPNFPTAFTSEARKQQQDQLRHAQLSFHCAMTTLRQSQEDDQISPDFSKIYGFLGDLFDKNIAHQDHSETLAELSLVDREIVRMLMMNLEWNIGQHQYRDQHSVMLEKYQSVIDKQEEEFFKGWEGEEEANEKDEQQQQAFDQFIQALSEESEQEGK